VVYMASAEHEPIAGVWGRSPQWGPGAKPLIRGAGGETPPKAGSILISDAKQYWN